MCSPPPETRGEGPSLAEQAVVSSVLPLRVTSTTLVVISSYLPHSISTVRPRHCRLSTAFLPCSNARVWNCRASQLRPRALSAANLTRSGAVPGPLVPVVGPRLLANPKYTGYMVWNRRATKKGGRFNPPETWVWSEQPTHEPVVTRGMFDAAADVAKKEQRSRTAQAPTSSTPTPRESICCDRLCSASYADTVCTARRAARPSITPVSQARTWGAAPNAPFRSIPSASGCVRNSSLRASWGSSPNASSA